MYNLTILSQLRFISIIAILFFTLYMSMNYIFTKKTIDAVDKINTQQLQVVLYDNKNLKILEAIILNIKEDSNNDKITSILKNLEISQAYGRKIKLKEISNNLTMLINPLSSQHLEDMIKKQRQYFKALQQNSLNTLQNAQQRLSKSNHSYFIFTLLLSLSGLFIVSSLIYLLYKQIQRRFAKVQYLLENLNTKKPDFSQEINIELPDEIGQVLSQVHSLHKKLEKDYKTLEKLKIKAEETAQIKSDFLANMSHEIRTPMYSIMGMSYLTLQTKLSPQQKDFIEKIDHSAKNLLSIINNILDASKIEAGKLTLKKIDFNLHKIINDSITLLEFERKDKKLDFELNYANNIATYYYGDALRLSQILNNLLSNAVKFTSKGKVSLSVSKIKPNRFQFKIKDTGIGLDKKEQQNIFKAFIQADAISSHKHQGTGLGLTISKQLVEMMNGRIWVESEHEQGSNFIFEIELIEKNSTKPVPEESFKKMLPKNITQLSGKHILLVEDNVINQQILMGLLEDSGIIIDLAQHGEEAILLHQKNAYALILMDIQMPILDGYETSRIIRKHDSKIPIIAVTASDMKEEISKMLKAGITDYLTKPIEVTKLYEQLLHYGT
ncbi:MAG: Signal transduction histidine kinase [uncultured Sulfurovum sp.]|uniref:Sensory/regulatory protein RpfC n=1 Tax=uncultured Sulfurovum sp. TaxID=269237 RepID=A0A6S6STJ8_9BACT|nr:MAG: Signal transduction histidine kinase [uncultured Sulfurovum sp.]